MKERYYVESVTDLIRPAICTALNRQYRDGAERRAAQKAHA